MKLSGAPDLILLTRCVDLLNIAQRYLRRLYSSPILQCPSAHLTVSLACVLYLVSSLDLIDPQFSDDKTRSQVSHCFHDLQLYANDHWLDHLSALANSSAESITDRSLMLCLSQSLERLTKRHNKLATIKSWNAQDDGEFLAPAIEELWTHFQVSVTAQSLLKRAQFYRSKSAEGDQNLNNSCMYKAVLFHQFSAILIMPFSANPDGQDDPTLFSSIRARYQSILEELLEHNSLNDVASSNFAARHHSGRYLCRYRNCPRATEGFNSSELRHEHESSHAAHFRCTDPACDFFEKALKSHTAMNKHNTKYHGDDVLTVIPSFVRSASARQQQDKPRFLLKESSSISRKRSFSTAKEDEVTSEVDKATNSAFENKKSRPSLDHEQQDYLIKCICGYGDDDANTVYCDLCETWQHTQCYYVDQHGNVPTKEELEVVDHFCVDCQPRPLDVKGAKDRQMKRIQRPAILARDEVQENERQKSPQQNTTDWPTNSYWSVPEQEDVRMFVRAYGTDWNAIANHMKSKTHTMVWNPKLRFGVIAD